TFRVPFPLQVGHFFDSSFFSTNEALRTNSPSTNAARSPVVAVAHHSSRVLSGLPIGTGSLGGGGLRRVKMLGPPPTRSVESGTGVPLTWLSRPPSCPPLGIHEPSPYATLRGLRSRFFHASFTSSGVRPSFFADSSTIVSSSLPARATASSNFTFDPVACDTSAVQRERIMSQTFWTAGSSGGSLGGSWNDASRSARAATIFISIRTRETDESLHSRRRSSAVQAGSGGSAFPSSAAARTSSRDAATSNP